MSQIENTITQANNLMEEAKTLAGTDQFQPALIKAFECIFTQNNVIIDLLRDMRHRQTY